MPAKTKHRTTLSLVKIYSSFHTNYNDFRSVFRYLSGNRSVLNSVTIDYIYFCLLASIALSKKNYSQKLLAFMRCHHLIFYFVRSHVEYIPLVRIKINHHTFLNMFNIQYSNRSDLNKRFVKIKL